MKIFLPFAFALASLSAQAQIYKWTDAKGLVHYADHPQEGIRTQEIPVPQAQPAPTAAQDNWQERDRLSSENWRRQTEADRRNAAAQEAADARQRSFNANNRLAANTASDEQFYLLSRGIRRNELARRSPRTTITITQAHGVRPQAQRSGVKK